MYETLYLGLHLIIFPAWALLLLAPRWSWTQRLVHTAFFPLLLGAVYASFLSAGIFFGQASDGAGFSTLAGVMALFAHPVGALTGGTHYLLFGPVGLAIYLVGRKLTGKGGWGLAED